MSMSQIIQHQKGVTTRGAIELGMERPIRTVITQAGVIQEIDQIVIDIWGHYCGADIDNLTNEFADEARGLIINKYSSLGVNEIREAFILASTNQIDVNLAAYHGKISLQVIGNCLSKYMALRNKIATDIIKQKHLKDMEKDELDQAKKREAYEVEVIEWFNSGVEVSLDDCKFYMYQTLEDKGMVSVTPDKITSYKKHASAIIRKRVEDKRSMANDILELREINSELRDLFISNKNTIINLAKELALFDIMNSRNK